MLTPGTTTFVSNGQKFTLEVREDKPERGYRPNKVRAFVWGAPEVDDQPIHDLAKSLGFDTIHTHRFDANDPAHNNPALQQMDAAWDAHNRQLVSNEREVLIAGLQAIGQDPAELKPKFSRTAGCSCGCSPGFILREVAYRVIYINPVKSEATQLPLF